LIVRQILVAAIAAASLANPSLAAERPGERTFRSLYKELVETNTTHSSGDCTLAATRMAARLKAAGFADADLNVFVPEGLPLDGGLIATFAGSDPKLGTVMLLAHLDVVEAKREDWTRDPFTLIEEETCFLTSDWIHYKPVSIFQDFYFLVASSQETIHYAEACHFFKRFGTFIINSF
jgi:hypothetical protein